MTLNAFFWVPERPVARMVDQLSVSQPTPCEIQALFGGLQVLNPDGGGLNKVDVDRPDGQDGPNGPNVHIWTS